jgi:hypothetical protein
MMVRRLATGVLFFGLAVPAMAAVPRSSQNEPAQVFLGDGGERVLARASSEIAVAPSPAAAGSASPSALPAASPAASPSAEIITKAREEFEHDRTAKLDRSRFGPQLNGMITDALYAQVSSKLQGLGEVKSFTSVGQAITNGVPVYVFRIACAKPPVLEQAIGWDATGKVVVLGYRPAQN